MSQQAVGQSHMNEPIGGDSRGTPNGIESTSNGENAHIDATHFGIFHDQVQDGVQRLKDGLNAASGAIDELTKTFSQHGKIVKAVGERWETDQALEEEIRTLKIRKEEVWNHIEQDREKHSREISDLKMKHMLEVSKLQTQADSGKQEKQRYEEMQRRLEDQQNKVKQSMDKELKAKKTQLETENAEKILNLTREKSELEGAKALLKQELTERTKELGQEKQTRTTMQDKLGNEIEDLRNALSDIKAKYQMGKKPSQFYLDRYKVLIRSVGKIATSYFTNLPDKAIEEPVGTSTQLWRKVPTFAKIPIADSECSQVLRLANVQHFIFNVICSSLWQPFFSKYLWKHKRDRSTLTEIYSLVEVYGKDVQQNWKVSTLKTLDQLDDAVDVGKQVDELISQTVIARLQPLLDDSQTDQFKDELKIVFTDAIELGKIAERDQSPVYIDTTPSMSDRDGWKEYLSEEYETSDANDLSATSLTMDPPPEALFVSPKIFRWTARATATATATTSATSTATATAIATTTATACRSEIEVIQPGLALFPITGIFQEGASDWQKISGAGREVAKNINGKARRQSMSTSMSSSVIMPRSPPQPSKRWSREGTREFD